MNYFKTAILLVVLAMLLIWVGGLIGGQHGAMIALIFALVLNLGSFWFSDRIVLAMYRAQELPEDRFPEVYRIVRELAANAKIPRPRVYLAPNDVPNAFATGRDPQHAVVCLTRGILNILSREELKGVIAHEMAHIKNRDTLIMTVTAALASAVMMLAYMARWAAIFGGFGGRDSRDRGGGIIGLLAISIFPIRSSLTSSRFPKTLSILKIAVPELTFLASITRSPTPTDSKTPMNFLLYATPVAGIPWDKAAIHACMRDPMKKSHRLIIPLISD